MDSDREWIERAVALGRRGRGQVHPNPEVGCVLVRDERVVGEGFHAAFGRAHAEVAALDAAAGEARGATAYVSLEPCAHQGKTPPCTQALVAAGVARVVYGNTDPTTAGGGGAQLTAAGVSVTGPVLSEDRGRLENPAFFHWAEQRAPWVQIKLAMTLDGRISAAEGARTTISGEEATHWVHGLRASVDAVLVGSTTATVDDPKLTVRSEVVCARPPARVVLDSQARMSPEARMFQEEGGQVHLFVSETADPDRVNVLESAGATVHRVSRNDAEDTGLPLGPVMARLGEVGVRSVLCEGGGVLASSMIRDNLAQRIHLIVAPRSLGSGGVPAFTDDLMIDAESWRAFDALRASEWPDTGLGRDALISFRQAY